MGKIYSVSYDSKLVYSENANGMCYHKSRRIVLQPDSETIPRDRSDNEQTFLHELTHHILHAMGETKLNDNEKFVDMFSGFLHQALTTMEYDDE